MANYEIVYPEHSVEGVRRKRVFACLIDAVIIGLITMVISVLVGILGVFTFGLAWLLYGAITPIVAIIYAGMTVGSADQATLGMRAMGLKFRLDSGERADFIRGAAHIILFYLSITILTPLVLIVSFLNGRKRLLHDIIMGVEIVNA